MARAAISSGISARLPSGYTRPYMLKDPYTAMFLVAETLVDKHNVALAKGHCGQRMRRTPVGSDCLLTVAAENGV